VSRFWSGKKWEPNAHFYNAGLRHQGLRDQFDRWSMKRTYDVRHGIERSHVKNDVFVFVALWSVFRAVPSPINMRKTVNESPDKMNKK
jgi:hypothetical protein